MNHAPPVYAAIDVGSYSSKLVLAVRDASGWHRVLERVEVTGLGLGTPERHGLDPEGRQRTMVALREFLDLARAHRAQGVAAAGTAIFRQAPDAQEFLAQVRTDLQLELIVISGEQEAELTYSGALGGLIAAAGPEPDLAYDVGGRSTELAWGHGTRPGHRHSIDIGTVTLAQRYGLEDRVEPGAVVEATHCMAKALAALPLPTEVKRLVGIGATPGSLVAMRLQRPVADSLEVHGLELPNSQALEQRDALAPLGADERRRLPGLHPERAPVILAGAVIVGAVGALWSSLPTLVSATGLREGLLNWRFPRKAGS